MTNFSGDLYVDTTAGATGDGSSGDPWDSLDDFMTASPNLTGATTIHVSGGQDTISSELDFSSITGQSSSNTLTIQGDDTYTYDFGSGYYLHRSTTASFALIRNPNPYTYFRNFRAHAENTSGGDAICIAITTTGTYDNINGERCWFKGSSSGTGSYTLNFKKHGSTTSNNYWDNCIIQNTNAGGNVNMDYEGTDITFRKSLLIGGTYGLVSLTTNGTRTVTGCIVVDHATSDFNGSGSTEAISYTGANSAETGTGNYAFGTLTDQFSDYANDDFRPKSATANQVDSGTSVGEAFDILGNARSATYDSGPYEYQAASTGSGERGARRGILRGVFRGT